MGQFHHCVALSPPSSTTSMSIPFSLSQPPYSSSRSTHKTHLFRAISLSFKLHHFPVSISKSNASIFQPAPFAFNCNPISGSRLVSNFSGSDMVSQLELRKPDDRRKPEKRVNGIFWILLLNLGIFVADHFLQVRAIRTLYLYHNQPAWYQFVTAAFCHANWNHISSNLFFLYIFGKLVEEEEGSFGLWLSYILTGAGANLVSWLVLPRNAVSVGASGAVFGLFAISVLVKMSWDWRKILEVLILGQFVIDKVMEAAQASAGLSNGFLGTYAVQNVNHIAHLSGALVGVLLVWLVSRIPSPPSEQEESPETFDKLK